MTTSPSRSRPARGGLVAPLGALVSALLTLGCCLPLGFIGAAGAAAAAAVLTRLRPWLVLASAGLLGLGFFQLYRGARCGVRPGKLRLILLTLAAGVFVLVVLFPQVVAGWVADLP